MKTILAPTDFSKISNNAIDYAAKLAHIAHARLVLLNVYHIPAMTSEVPVVIPDLERLEKNSINKLQEIQKRLFQSFGKTLQVELVSKCGFATEEISLYADSIKPDMIVTGITGADYISERIFGSVATSLMIHSKHPVLMVGDGIEFKIPAKIIFACDYNELENATLVGPLIKLIKLFKSHLYVLNVERELEPAEPAGEIVSGFMKLENVLQGVDHSFHFIETEKVREGINEFVSMTNGDMVVMMPKKHGALAQMFKESTTKQMAFHSKVPLYTLPNTQQTLKYPRENENNN